MGIVLKIMNPLYFLNLESFYIIKYELNHPIKILIELVSIPPLYLNWKDLTHRLKSLWIFIANISGLLNYKTMG
jgi:hypothetical protein